MTKEPQRIFKALTQLKLLRDMGKTTHDWYVARVMGTFLGRNAVENHDSKTLIFPFGGTLEEVKEYIDDCDIPAIKDTLTWVPSEYVEEYLYGNITYPI